MKTILLTVSAALLATVLSLTASGQATPSPAVPIGYVSAQRILAESAEGKAGLARAQAMQQQKATDLRARQQALETTRQQLAQAGDGTARTQLMLQENQQRTDLDRATAQAQTDLQALQRQVNADLLGPVKSALDQLAKDQGIQLVLNGDTSVIWAAPGVDLTAAVIERLNAKPAAPPKH